MADRWESDGKPFSGELFPHDYRGGIDIKGGGGEGATRYPGAIMPEMGEWSDGPSKSPREYTGYVGSVMPDLGSRG